jgi:hypothetical protein
LKKFRIGEEKASLVDQGMGKFAPPKSAGYSFYLKGSPYFPQKNAGVLGRSRVNTIKFHWGIA